MGKMFSNHISDKWLISKIHKEFIELNSKKQTKKTQSDLKMGNLNIHFSKEDIQMANMCLRKILNITKHQGNTNKNYNAILPHTCQNTYYPKKKKNVGKNGE